MSRTTLTLLAAFFVGILVEAGTFARAQAPRGPHIPRPAARPAPENSGLIDPAADEDLRSRRFPGAGDLLRPYATHDGDRFQQAKREAPAPVHTTKRPAVSAPAVSRFKASVFESNQTYYPTMRAGRGANSNAIDPKNLCVPNRAALIMRGR